MLSRQELDSRLKERLDDGRRVVLAYSFLPQSDAESSPSDRAATVMRYVAGEARAVYLDNGATAYFQTERSANRIPLSLGALVLPLQSKRLSPSLRFSNHTAIVDVLRCEDGWWLEPSSAAVVYSNEWLQLPHDLTGIVFSRVSQYVNGLVVSASYVDPRWRGLVRLHLYNSSDHAIRLRLGEPIAQMMLLKGYYADAGPVLTDESLSDAAHYGKTWKGILERGGDPFGPRPPTSSRKWSTMFRRVNNFLREYAGITILAFLLSVAVAAFGFLNDLRSGLSERLLVRDSITVPIAADTRSGMRAYRLPSSASVGSNSLAFVQPVPADVDISAHARIDRGDIVKIVITVNVGGSGSPPRTVDVNWMIVP